MLCGGYCPGIYSELGAHHLSQASGPGIGQRCLFEWGIYTVKYGISHRQYTEHMGSILSTQVVY